MVRLNSGCETLRICYLFALEISCFWVSSLSPEVFSQVDDSVSFLLAGAPPLLLLLLLVCLVLHSIANLVTCHASLQLFVLVGACDEAIRHLGNSVKHNTKCMVNLFFFVDAEWRNKGFIKTSSAETCSLRNVMYANMRSHLV